MKQNKFTWNRKIILGGKTYGINDETKQIKNIYKTKEEQEKDDEIEPFEAIEATESGEGRFFKNPYQITQEELVNWAFYGTVVPVQDFFIAFNKVDNIFLMADLIELAESPVRRYMSEGLYQTTYEVIARNSVGYPDDELNELKVVINQLDKENRPEVIKKWITHTKGKMKKTK